jgi:ribosome-associated toxin RatA of RatAB toxin-antitoxin module
MVKGVKHLRVLEPLKSNERLTEWTVDIGGVVIGWWEKEILNEKQMTMSFRQTKGDFKRFEGQWKLHPLKEGTLLRIEVLLDWGVPRWEQTTGNIFAKKATLNLRLLLNGICKAMEHSDG